MSGRPDEHLHGLTREKFKERVNNLDAAGFAGLDTDTAGHIQEKYIGKYTMKGDSSSEATERAKRSVTEDYCERHAGGNKAIGNMVGKHMSELTNGET